MGFCPSRSGPGTNASKSTQLLPLSRDACCGRLLAREDGEKEGIDASTPQIHTARQRPASREPRKRSKAAIRDRARVRRVSHAGRRDEGALSDADPCLLPHAEPLAHGGVAGFCAVRLGVLPPTVHRTRDQASTRYRHRRPRTLVPAPVSLVRHRVGAPVLRGHALRRGQCRARRAGPGGAPVAVVQPGRARRLLSRLALPGPVPLPDGWANVVNEALPPDVLAETRARLRRTRPYDLRVSRPTYAEPASKSARSCQAPPGTRLYTPHNEAL